MQKQAPICLICKHLYKTNGLDLKCKAFPKGVPEEIMERKHDHRRPYKGDNDIQFEVEKGKEGLLKLLPEV